MADLDSQVSEINKEIQNCNEKILKGEIPDFSRMDSMITNFATEVRTLPNAEAKEYTDLLDMWGLQIRQITEALGIIKDSIAGKINEANAGGAALSAYADASKLDEN